MNYKEPDEKELQEILELAREAENSAREMCRVITSHTAKYRLWYEQQKPEDKSVKPI